MTIYQEGFGKGHLEWNDNTVYALIRDLVHNARGFFKPMSARQPTSSFKLKACDLGEMD